MTVLIKLFYAAAIAALLILLVAFGIRTFYAPPLAPEFPQGLAAPRLPTEQPNPEQQQEAQRQYQTEYETYEKRGASYHRNVFLAASIFGVVAILGGLMLPKHLDAIRLGLVAGGLGTLIYALIQAGGDLDEAGTTVVFLGAAIALILVFAVGYRWLSQLERSE